ncbi:MAG: hypothetical protein ABEJ98_00725 [Candidatus Nanohaloarchaea archaeon]
MTEFNKNRILNGEYPYDVLRNIAINNGNYPTQIAKEIGRGGREEANRLCSKLHERKMLSKQKDGNSTIYTIKGEGWTSLVEEIWNLDQTPEELEKALKEYVINYLIGEEKSTVQKMLYSDLHTVIISRVEYNDSETSEWLENFARKLQSNKEKDTGILTDYWRNALNEEQ